MWNIPPVQMMLFIVRSCGTEDRPTDRPVPPREETFEYIIFRGSDIKDIHVCEAPKPLVQSVVQDPAIVKVPVYNIFETSVYRILKFIYRRSNYFLSFCGK